MCFKTSKEPTLAVGIKCSCPPKPSVLKMVYTSMCLLKVQVAFSREKCSFELKLVLIQLSTCAVNGVIKIDI
jgi:hypothetical protein